jgi:hypothetical protein
MEECYWRADLITIPSSHKVQKWTRTAVVVPEICPSLDITPTLLNGFRLNLVLEGGHT